MQAASPPVLGDELERISTPPRGCFVFRTRIHEAIAVGIQVQNSIQIHNDPDLRARMYVKSL